MRDHGNEIDADFLNPSVSNKHFIGTVVLIVLRNT